MRRSVGPGYLFNAFLSLLLSVFFASPGLAGIAMDENMRMGMPLGDAEDVDLEMCPQGVEVIRKFMTAWQRGDYRTMYGLLDEESSKGYPFEQARLDFQFLEFKEYSISSIRKTGEDFEFLLSYGDWMDGNKEIKKMIISGRTFKIIMPTRNSPFKKSMGDYF